MTPINIVIIHCKLLDLLPIPIFIVKLSFVSLQLTDILKFGIDKLLNNEEESASENLDFDAILGGSENGEWQTQVDEEVKETQVSDIK